MKAGIKVISGAIFTALILDLCKVPWPLTVVAVILLTICDIAWEDRR